MAMYTSLLPMSKGHCCANCYWRGKDCIIEPGEGHRPNACSSFEDEDVHIQRESLADYFEEFGEYPSYIYL